MKLGPFDLPGAYTGDCRELLRELPDDRIQCVVTSPPYWGLRDYDVDGQLGLEETPEEYVASLVEVFREVRRALRPDGTLWLNLGDSYCAKARGSDEGWDKSRLTNPATVQKAQRAAMLDGRNFPGLKPKDLVGIPWRVAFALQVDGWWLRSDIVWSKPNPMPESVLDRPTRAHEYIFLLTKSEQYYYDAVAISEPAVTQDNRRPYAPGQVDGRGNGHDRVGGSRRRSSDPTRRNKRSVWTVTTAPYAGAHFAVFPPKLIEPCILAGARPGNIVLDPFFGSGTTGAVAEKYGRNWLGFELNPDYEGLHRERTAQRSLPLGGTT